eukprot:3603616-Alexandrium_andersonii.AAC.1
MRTGRARSSGRPPAEGRPGPATHPEFKWPNTPAGNTKTRNATGRGAKNGLAATGADRSCSVAG